MVQDVHNERILKRILLTRPEGKLGIGRQKVWWLDGVDQDSERVGERNWRRQDRNRDE